jgi:hypothetical protein
LSWPNFLQPFDDHTFARLDAVLNYPIVADCLAKLYRSNRHFVGAIDDRELLRALYVNDRLLRNQKRSQLG